MRKLFLLLFITIHSVICFGQYDLEKDFNYNVNDCFSFRDGFWSGPAAPKYTDYGKSTHFLIISKTSCGSCFKYAIKGVVDNYSIFVNQDNNTSTITHGYHPFFDTLYFCSTNPSYLAYFQAYKAKLSYTPRPATTEQVAFINSSFPPVDNRTPTNILLNTTNVYEGLPPGVFVAQLSVPNPGPFITSPIYTLETTCEAGEDNHFFDIKGDKLYVRETFDFATHSTLSIRIKADSEVGGFNRKDFTLTVLSDGGNQAPTDIQISSDSVRYDLPPNKVATILSAIDPDAVSKFSYQLVSGPGDIDNRMFSITDSLLIKRSFQDYYGRPLLKDSLQIRVRVFDGINKFFERQYNYA